MTDYLSLSSASFRRPLVSPRFGRAAVSLKKEPDTPFKPKAGSKGYPADSRLTGTILSRPLTVGLGLTGLILAPSWYFGPRSISTALGRLADKIPLPFLPTPPASSSPAQKVVQAAQSWWSGTKKVAAAGLSLLGIGWVGTHLLRNPAAEGVAEGGGGVIQRISTLMKNTVTSIFPMLGGDIDVSRPLPNGVNLRMKSGDISQSNADVIVVNAFDDLFKNIDNNRFNPGGGTWYVYNKIRAPFISAIKNSNFRGQLGRALLLVQDNSRRDAGQIPARYIICVGLGDRNKFNHNAIKAVGKTIIQKVNDIVTDHPITTVDTILHGAGVHGGDPPQCLQSLAEGFVEEMRENGSGNLTHISIVEYDKGKLRDRLIPALDRFVDGLEAAEE